MGDKFKCKIQSLKKLKLMELVTALLVALWTKKKVVFLVCFFLSISNRIIVCLQLII